MPIYNIVYCKIAEKSAGINSLKHFILYFKSAIAAGKIEGSDLYKTFLDFLL